MNTDSLIEPRSLDEIRSDYLGVEDGLESCRSLIRCASIFTGLWGLMLVLETFAGAHGTERHPHSWLPKFILIPEEVTSWHSGIGAVCVFALYYLMNYTMDALKPGAGKPYARTSAWLVVICIGLFGPICAPIFCIGPAITLLRPGSKVVLSAKYREVVEATPWISDVNRRKRQGDSRILMIVVLVITGLVIAGLAWAYWMS